MTDMINLLPATCPDAPGSCECRSGEGCRSTTLMADRPSLMGAANPASSFVVVKSPASHLPSTEGGEGKTLTIDGEVFDEHEVRTLMRTASVYAGWKLEADKRIADLEPQLAYLRSSLSQKEEDIGRLHDELHAIKYEVMGGEDVPGSASAATVDDVKKEVRRLRRIESAACQTCMGSGIVGGHMPDGSFDGQDCPACSLTSSRSEIARLKEALEKIAEWAQHTGRAEYDKGDAMERLNINREIARSALSGSTE